MKTFLDGDTEISYEIRLDIIRGITAGMEHLASERVRMEKMISIDSL